MAKSDSSDWTKKEQEYKEEIENLKKNLKNLSNIEKWGLVWNDQPQEVITEWKNKVPILEEFKNKEIKSKDDSPMNLLIEGDNYNSLSVLNYTHGGKVDMIYIDPPYNTGGTMMYNNNYVDEDDPYKHSIFLSILYHRLKIAQSLLKKNGVICCTIDDIELMAVLGIFEKLNAEVLNIITIVQKPEGRNQDHHIYRTNEYAIFATWGKPQSRKILPRMKIKQEYNLTASDGRRKYRLDTFYRRGDEKENPYDETRWYEIFVNKKTKEMSLIKKGKDWVPVLPKDTNGKELIWDSMPSDFEEAIENLDKKDPEFEAVINEKTGYMTIKRRRWEKYFSVTKGYWNHPDYSPQSYGAKLIPLILEKDIKFSYPKSVFSVYDCIDIFLPENGTVLDFFAGSGTTGHAVQLLNQRDIDMEDAFVKKFGKEYHKNKKFLDSDAVLYSHNPKSLSPKKLEDAWVEWRKNKGKRRFILCTNNEIPAKKLEKLRKTKGWSKKKEINSPEGICKKITYPRMKGVAKGFKWKKDQVRRLLFPLTSEGRIIQTEKWKDDKVPGFPFNMKYYKINFIPFDIDQKKSDGNKISLVNNSTNMICIQEDCFDEVKHAKEKFHIFKNHNKKYLGIVFDDAGIEPIIKEIKKILDSSEFIIYILTLDKNSRNEEFDEIKNTIKIVPTPKDIIADYENVKRKYYDD